MTLSFPPGLHVSVNILHGFVEGMTRARCNSEGMTRARCNLEGMSRARCNSEGMCLGLNATRKG